MKMVFSKYSDYKISKTTHLKSYCITFGQSTLNEPSYILVFVKLTNTYIKTNKSTADSKRCRIQSTIANIADPQSRELNYSNVRLIEHI